ncbi:TetR family transcriptional regulator [Amycolatopsis antarctica]|uniref:TetR family transcriptional regulator n=1 Tax=Amycolatopsis antarctica TaxID=1854586 RepID=A0A263D1T2_9PSEU|nr:TetR/AcrR family transcriptional regulator [Amycolatopsis antarctica]OZM71315.1 TetR family transcriptional regulator [Amycolatopsis antarctica]
MSPPIRRGAHLLDAVVEVVAEHGIGAVSMRSVAAAAGVSTAQVQYYFPSKDRLVAAAFEHVCQGVERRGGGVDTSGTAREVLSRLLRLWLPSDAGRARDARVWLAFTAAAATSPALRAINDEVERDLRAGFAGLLRDARQTGELPQDRDPELHAVVLLAVVDGLVTQAVLAPGTDRQRSALAERGLDAHLTLLFGKERT